MGTAANEARKAQEKTLAKMPVHLAVDGELVCGAEIVRGGWDKDKDERVYGTRTTDRPEDVTCKKCASA